MSDLGSQLNDDTSQIQNTNVSLEISQLIDMGFSMDDAMKAIGLSLVDANQPLVINDNKNIKLDLEESVNYLMDMGYSNAESLDALIAAKYDINLAVEYIITGMSQTNKLFLNITQQSTTSSMLTLTKLGFTDKQAICALTLARGDVELALEYLLTDPGDCNGSIKTCKHLVRLNKILKQYATSQINININIQLLLNDFNHLLSEHDCDADIEYIYNSSVECDVLKCLIIKRKYRRNNIAQLDDQKVDKKKLLDCRIIDKIHCHFKHRFDIGCRLTANERQQFLVLDEKNVDDNDQKAFTDGDIKIKTIRNILAPKHKLYQTLSNESFEKFNQLQQPTYAHYKTFSFGQRFYYWKYFKNCQNYSYDDRLDPMNLGYEYSDWYVPPKYNCLKEELLKNGIEKIRLYDWQYEYNKATEHQKTDYCKQFLKGMPEVIHKRFACSNTTLYGYQAGTPIEVNHLIAVSIYCGYSTLSYKFSETFRRLDITQSSFNISNSSNTFIIKWSQILSKQYTKKESNVSFKKRHSNFHHLSKYIHEAVNLFTNKSKIYFDGKHTFYHGVNNEMIFDSMKCRMNQPFSTTGEWEVALNFSSRTGMVLEFHRGMTTRYFDCTWISKFPEESELLFISVPSKLQFINITDIVKSKDYKLFVQAITIIDTVTDGTMFQSDKTVYSKYIQRIKLKTVGIETASIKQIMNTLKYGAKNINPALKLLTIKLIKHELHRYKPATYSVYQRIDKYIDTLLHSICSKKTTIQIDFELMNFEISTRFMDDGGYQGYLFLKDLFFNNDCELKLDFISLLFPNAVSITLHGTPSISKSYINYILKYLSNNRTAVQMMNFVLNDNENDLQLSVNSYQQQFRNVGWSVIGLPNRFALAKSDFADSCQCNECKQRLKVSPTVSLCQII